MKDGFGREISYMRISITDKCNLRCTYCMGAEGCLKETVSKGTRPESEIQKPALSVEEIGEITEAAAAWGIHKIRITGGEPLIRPDAVKICKRIKMIPEIQELTVTTNGILLERYADALKDAGVDRVNISLDTLQEEKYRRITKTGEIQAVLRGIQAAKAAGLHPIKINVVLLKNFNEDEIADFVALTRNAPVEVRFIELMPIGEGKKYQAAEYLAGETVLKKVPLLQEVEESGVARMYRLPDGLGKVGLIRPVSRHFCPTCNRIRLTCEGALKPCLHSEEEIDIRHLHGVELKQAMKEAILHKPMAHEDFTKGAESCSNRAMYQIGG